MKRYITGGRKYNIDKAFSGDADVRAEYAERIKDPELLEIYSHDPALDVRAALARNPNITAEIARTLVDDVDFYDSDDLYRVTCELATNPSTPADVLDLLADSNYLGILVYVSYNANTSAETLTRLAEKTDAPILAALCRNPNTPPKIVDKIIRNSPVQMAEYASENPNALPETLAYIHEVLPINFVINMQLAKNPNTPNEVLQDFVKDTYLKERAMQHPNYEAI